MACLADKALIFHSLPFLKLRFSSKVNLLVTRFTKLERGLELQHIKPGRDSFRHCQVQPCGDTVQEIGTPVQRGISTMLGSSPCQQPPLPQKSSRPPPTGILRPDSSHSNPSVMSGFPGFTFSVFHNNIPDFTNG